MFICSTNELARFCDMVLQDSPESIAVDTEFSRSFNDYYPKLCLLQIAYGEQKCVVDVLQEGLDLSPLHKVFADTKIFKVFHDCRQDLDALALRFPRLPYPVFDTQVAAMLCHYYENSVGYSRLVEQFLDVKLNKLSFKRVDWSKRPLSESKVRYALDDVIYLHKLYGILKDILAEKGRLSWCMQDMAQISDMFTDNYDAMLEGMEFYRDLTEQELAISRAVVEWREKAARCLNINRNIIMSSKCVLGITKDFMSSGDDNVLSKYIQNTYLKDVPFGITEMVDKNRNAKHEKYNKMSQDHNIQNVLAILLHEICVENGVSQKLVASKRDLVRAISRLPSSIMHGWRYEFFGYKVENFVDGKVRLVFSMNENNRDRLIVSTE